MELASLLPGIDGFIAGLDVIDRAALEKADRLKVIARYGVGVDKVDLEAAKEKALLSQYTRSQLCIRGGARLGLMLALQGRSPKRFKTSNRENGRGFLVFPLKEKQWEF